MSERIFMIADTHFGDEAILRYEKRPYVDATKMDEAMIQNWNRIVDAEDTVYHLGDFSVPEREGEYLSKLNGHKILVKGNHDMLSNQKYRELGFEEVYDKPVILEQFWILSHEPLYVNENMPYANLFGHVHASPLYHTYSKQHYCVSVERIGYGPIAFDEIRKQVKEAAVKLKNSSISH